MLFDRGFYISIHTTNEQAGELWGQVLPAATAYFTTTLDPFDEVQPINTGAQRALAFELNGNVMTLIRVRYILT